jgi:hypothetical protein
LKEDLKEMRELTKMIGEIDEEDEIERKTELGLN